jgi:NAD(P)-dependent dehydrogenase (short-subunit alcohol dehydrogenase family)
MCSDSVQTFQQKHHVRILVIGGKGTIGSAIVKALGTRHDAVTAGHTHGVFHLDRATPDSTAQMYQSVGRCDAVGSAAGIAGFAGLNQLTYEDYLVGLRNKQVGQVNLVRLGKPFLRDGGSFTMTSGFSAGNR